jgi:hypothetical protein
MLAGAVFMVLKQGYTEAYVQLFDGSIGRVMGHFTFHSKLLVV